MREILFRGKSNGGIDKWIEGTGVFNDGINTWISFNEPNHAIAYGIKHHIVLPETVGQYTGLTDKNGKRIFEGDIITMPKYGKGKHKSLVYFKNGKFAVDGSNYAFKDICPRNMEIIGNIHDNPELLKV